MSIAIAQSVRPSKAWYALAGALVVAAAAWLVLGLVLGLHSLSDKVEGFQRAEIPGQAELTFAEPGGYVIYYEGPGANADGATVPGFNVLLTPADGSAPVVIHNYTGSLTYGVSGHAGRAAGTFRIDQPGSYSLSTLANVPQVEGATVAIGPSIGGSIAGLVLRALAPALALFLAGAAVAILVAIRRNRASRPAPPSYAPDVQGWTT